MAHGRLEKSWGATAYPYVNTFHLGSPDDTIPRPKIPRWMINDDGMVAMILEVYLLTGGTESESRFQIPESPPK